MPESSSSLSPALPGQLADLPQLAQFAMASMSIGRQHLAMAQLSDALKNRGAEDVFISHVQAASRTVAAAVATRIAADAAMLVGCDQETSQPGTKALVACLEGLHQQIAEAGIRFVQACWDVDGETPPFAAAGYEAIARLDYLSARMPAEPVAEATLAGESRQTPDAPSPAEDRLVVCPIDPRQADQQRRMTKIVTETFVGTQDCPALNRYRTPSDIVAAYLESPAFDPSGWSILQWQQQDVACVITTPYVEARTLELTYMGVVPGQRGRGWGRQLIDEAFRIARRLRCEELMLAVDQANTPARHVYHQAGFQTIASEAVWGRVP
ncbi:GNAT family N-acetyltransferase [Roseimaritima sediminicola]|uniref:GNAT family N-acetyltransferase n=1 Tax=Roseimaritima sediminicola TaxID=2662066 RepID=UPI00129850F8|nr:GNAT family N-acetyltransferase [Roseimaritima sediminicola]